jgi:hypothetical protein
VDEGRGDAECARHREAVSALLDDDGRPEDLFIARNHLKRCPSCRAFADRAAAITASAHGLDVDVPDLVPAVLAAWSATPDADADGAADRPPALLPLTAVGAPACGCSAGCPCGCQVGEPCRCGSAAA